MAMSPIPTTTTGVTTRTIATNGIRNSSSATTTAITTGTTTAAAAAAINSKRKDTNPQQRAFIRSHRRKATERRDHSAGRQERSATDHQRRTADPRKNDDLQYSRHPRRQPADRAAWRDRSKDGSRFAGYLHFPGRPDRYRIPPRRRLSGQERQAARIGYACRPDAGAISESLYPKTGRRQDRPAASRHPYHRF